MASDSDECSFSTERNKDLMLKWTKEQTENFISLRGQNSHLFTGTKNSATVAWRSILEKMGLQDVVTPSQAKKKWDNLKKKYKDCKYPGSGEGVKGKPTAATWPWFVQMDEILGQRPSIRPPVLISSLPDETPGSSAAVGGQQEDEDGVIKRGQKRRSESSELLDLIKEDMRLQREAEDRRAQESKERLDKLLSILQKIAEK
ncbi:uncharacterized protein LOC106965261 [Poecilia latipinna]|uniref:uncharacterized protein LOC103147756 n=1 Tax=Poecilia formosa TaxID=48698 RepID=UPI000443D00C|nr:PREDICTED: uncharacterized protein LOC103147756 [Poecilia formosa]XP_014835245.1 PREDICTED: uncharacterized protein LOC106912994 [Poecilia mexicana]XP_014916736.1 PREDICTED: uncharacterized protein LOC106965261 [Poecilia latipinna]